jgi:predicted metal-binding membrane protein
MANEKIEYTAELKFYLFWPWLLVLTAWSTILYLNSSDLHSPLDHDYLLTTSHFPWWLALLFFFISWPVMVVAMMLPSALSTLAQRRGGLIDQLTFLLAYLIVWQFFAVGAFVGDALLHQLARHWLWLALHSQYITATLLLLAGTFQFSQPKRSGLARCCNREKTGYAWHEGWHYGLACVTSCWMLMLLMFASGGKAPSVLAALTLIVLLEKNAPRCRWLRPLLGAGLLLLGLVWLLFF